MKTYLNFIKNIENNPKFTDFQYKIDNLGMGKFGFKLARKNSYVYFWFHVYADSDCIMFWHSYSQNTGKSSYSYKKVRSILWENGYFSN